jgi:hypothetical protein
MARLAIKEISRKNTNNKRKKCLKFSTLKRFGTSTLKRLRFSDLNQDKHDRPSVHIPVREKIDEKPKDTKRKDRGVLIINPDGTTEKMGEDPVSTN